MPCYDDSYRFGGLARLLVNHGGLVMGKGDMRTKRGKIVRRTHGKVRLKHALKKKRHDTSKRPAVV